MTSLRNGKLVSSHFNHSFLQIFILSLELVFFSLVRMLRALLYTPTGWDVYVLSFRPIYTCSHKLLVYLCSLVERHSSAFYASIVCSRTKYSQRTIRKTWKGLWHKLKVLWHTVVCSTRRSGVGFLFDISQVPAKLCIFVVKVCRLQDEALPVWVGHVKLALKNEFAVAFFSWILGCCHRRSLISTFVSHDVRAVWTGVSQVCFFCKTPGRAYETKTNSAFRLELLSLLVC